MIWARRVFLFIAAIAVPTTAYGLFFLWHILSEEGYSHWYLLGLGVIALGYKLAWDTYKWGDGKEVTPRTARVWRAQFIFNLGLWGSFLIADRGLGLIYWPPAIVGSGLAFAAWRSARHVLEASASMQPASTSPPR